MSISAQPQPTSSMDAVILIVDDVAGNRQVLASLLRKAGYQVLSAMTAQQALQIVNRQLPDLIMLDILMPGIDGYMLCRQLRSDPKLQKIPIIFLSSLTEAIDKVKAFESGGADYVTKPYQAEEVLARVEHQLKIARLQRALEHEKAELIRINQKLAATQAQAASVFNVLGESLPGVTIDGKYRIDAKIGSGGFGVVFRAIHIGLERPVALKVFRPLAPSTSPNALSRFLREGISTCRVNHPNAVTVLDSGISTQGIAYLVMELLSGMTLHAEMWQMRRLPLERCLQIVVPLCDVLTAAHDAGIVHRDIKPENIYLHQTGNGEVVKVLDFGIAKVLGEEAHNVNHVVTAANDFVGTPSYMAPERMDGAACDGRSDVYSVGVMLYEMLAGELPFPDRNQPFLRVMFNHLHGTPTPLRTHLPDLPQSLESLVFSALAKNKDSRPSAQSFRDELIQIAQQDSPVPARDAKSRATNEVLLRTSLPKEIQAQVAQQWNSDDSKSGDRNPS